MEKSMGRIFFLIFLTIGMVSGPAFGSTHTQTNPASFKPEAVAALTLQPDPELAKINASYRQGPDQAVTLNPVVKKEDPDWQYVSALLTTLVLIGVIAVRRHTSGNS
jgi:hypothetical protein